MTTSLDDSETLSAFKRDSSAVAKRLKKSGKPMVLTVHGKAEMVIQDAAAYRRLQELAALADAAEMAAFLKRSADDMETGNTVPAAEFVKSLGRS